jgi:4-hydroxy-4-methyl-2-oxoglutarate aldolase
MIEPITAELLRKLRRLDTPTISNAIEYFEVRLRNEGFTDGSIRCQFPQLAPLVGHAVTAKIRCSGPPVDRRAVLERNDWWETIRSVPGPKVFVVEDLDATPGQGALLGEVHANILMALDCVGAVTNGAVRDLPAVSAMGFQFFAAHPAASHSYAHIVEIGGAVKIGGLTIQPGDLLHGDAHGVVNIPIEIASKIPSIAERLQDNERKLIGLCRVSDFSVESLRQALQESL